MALHDELAELGAEVGPQVFDDPVAFRAAFDDYVPEGSATTGEVSLLVGAIATGALQRLREQLALGADVDTSIAMQGDLLARDRGTSESSGARWALSALAHAMGAIPADQVLTRPAPGPDSIPTAERSPGTAERPGSTAQRPTGEPAYPDSVDTGPTRPVHATQVAGDGRPSAVPPPAPTAGRTGSARNPLLIGAVVVLAIIAVTAVALLFLRDGDPSEDTAKDDTSTSDDASASGDPSGNPDEEVLAQIEMSDAGKTVRLQLVVDGTDAAVVLLTDDGDGYAEVDRIPAGCPFLTTSYDAGIEDQGDQQIYWGWQNDGNEGFGAYGEVRIEEEFLRSYLGDDPVCPDEH